MSSVSEELGGTGAWSVSLRPDTPGYIRDQLSLSPSAAAPRAGFASLFVTDGYRGSSPSFNAAQSGALWWGVLRDRSNNGLELSGPGPSFWLGDEDGKWRISPPAGTPPYPYAVGYVPPGDPFELIAGVPGTPTFWASAMANSAILTTGTIGSTPAIPYFGYWARLDQESPRRLLQLAADAFGFEWRVRPTGVLDMATPAEIYGTATRLVVGSELWPGAMPSESLICTSGNVVFSESLAEWVSRWNARTNTTLATPGTATRPDPFRHWISVVSSTPLGWGGYSGVSSAASVGSASSPATMSAARARSERDAHNYAAVLTVDVNSDAIPRIVPVGGTIGVWEPDHLIVGTTPVNALGQWIRPVSLRVLGAEWPIREGSGVYVFPHAPNTPPIDLTDWVEWGSGPTRLTVGGLRLPSLSQTIRRREWNPAA